MYCSRSRDDDDPAHVDPPDVEVVHDGRWYPVDADGYLRNDTAWSHVLEPWRSVVSEAVRVIPRRLPGAESLVLRGSVPRGMGRPGRSDLDLVVFLRSAEDLAGRHIPETMAHLSTISPSVPRVDLDVVTTETALATYQYRHYRYILSFQALLLWGRDLASRVDPVRPTAELATLLPLLEERVEHARKEIDVPRQSPTTVAWLMRTLVRTGLELTLAEPIGYTRDLSLCVDAASTVLPEHRNAFELALFLAVNPHRASDDLFPALVDPLVDAIIDCRNHLGF